MLPQVCFSSLACASALGGGCSAPLISRASGASQQTSCGCVMQQPALWTCSVCVWTQLLSAGACDIDASCTHAAQMADLTAHCGAVTALQMLYFLPAGLWELDLLGLQRP